MEFPDQDERDIEVGNSLFYFLITVSKLGLSKNAEKLLTNPVDMERMEDFLLRQKSSFGPKRILIL